MGDCSRIGRHEANGLVPCLRYSSMVSRLMASRDAGSDLPLYFFWIACISGASSCMPRDALICRKNSGISAMRMTITRPTIDSAQAAPPFGSRPSVVNSAWNCDHDPADDQHDRVEQTVKPTHAEELLGGESVRGRGRVEMTVGVVHRRNVVDAARRSRGCTAAPARPRGTCRAIAPWRCRRDHRVLRARRVVPAGRRCHRRDEQLVPADQRAAASAPGSARLACSTE